MEHGDLGQLHALSLAVGWPHRVEDWQLALEIGEGVVITQDDGPVLGCAMWWPFGEELATLGMVIVAPALQGRRIGRRLIRGLLRRTGSRSVRLVSTKAGHNLYVSEGFKPSGKLVQYQGTVVARDVACDRRVRAGVPGDWTYILAIDRAAGGGERSVMLKRLADEGSVKVLVERDRIEGYAFCRLFGRGRIIGPVVARDTDRGQALIAAHLRDYDESFVRVDVLDPDRSWNDLLSGHGLAEVDRLTTMTLGKDLPAIGAARIALASQALG